MDFDEEFEREFLQNLENIKKQKNGVEEDDKKIFAMVERMHDRTNEKIPEPTKVTISTRSAMCKMSEENIHLHLGKLVSYLSKKIFDNYFEKNKRYPILGLEVDNLMIRYDEAFIQRYKRPYIKFNNELVNPFIQEDCNQLLERIMNVERQTLEKQGRQKEKKENEHFYNSCSIVVKPSRAMKCINIKLFNNGKITLTGSKEGDDGLMACQVLLEELKRESQIFLEMEEEKIAGLRIIDYETTMINSDFDLNFKVDLTGFLNVIQRDSPNIYTKFNPEKYRGFIIGFFWNSSKGDLQDGICRCETRCKGKGKGMGIGECKKVTISIFKSGSTIITGARSERHIEDAYAFLQRLIHQYYKNIVKISVVDLIDRPNDEINFEDMEKYIQEQEKKVEEEELKKKKKKMLKQKS